MSTYNGRRGPNVSQYIRELNTISPQDTTAEENFNMEEDLALFANTQFFDFDSGQNTDLRAQPAKVDGQAGPATEEAHSATQSVMGDMPNLDFMSNDFSFPEFTNGYPTPASAMNTYDGTQNYQPISANQPAMYGPIPPAQHQYPQSGAPTPAATSGAEKRPSNANVSFEDLSRQAAEEDKRKRNTAASARFRVKKKQREQALEKSAKEMSDKLSAVESKLSQLETENKWLKNLLVEKHGGNDGIAAMWTEFTKQASDKFKAGENTKADSK